MGGSGSGSWQQGKALTTERKRLDIRDMRSGARRVWPVVWRWNDGTTTTVLFSKGLAAVEVRVPGQAMHPTHVELDETPLHFGGHRIWWRCPCCHTRVAVLYWQRGNWQCRKCADLVHESTRQGGLSRAYAQVNRIRRELGWGGGLLSPTGGRRKGLHWSSYARLMRELTEASLAAAGEHDIAIERVEKQLRKIRIPA